jgi:hypothetical protein
MLDILLTLLIPTFFISLFGFLLFGAATALRLREIDPEKAKELGIPDDESLGLF